MSFLNLTSKLIPGVLASRATAPRAMFGLSMSEALQQLGDRLFKGLSSQAGLRVWTTVSPTGRLRWHAYDATCDRQFETESEDSLRQWIETCYYR